ncbi:AI-2E family transporter [Hydrogenoanaerobacterium sp.]|uniref:AI-2E family transporter n=1 Tax=Hydrogenoanaerobacterium sp. TaxID=2953763 RepID=UPI0028A08AD2|nr:AI-2E family transporter [Hydrogenoanaerobacterium sp.]
MKKLDSTTKYNIRTWIVICTYVVLLFVVLVNARFFLGLAGKLVDIISPFLVGFGIAFVLNRPMMAIEAMLPARMSRGKWGEKLKRPVAMLITYVLFLLLLTLLISLVLPQIITSISTLVSNFPSYLTSLQNTADELVVRFGISSELLQNVVGSWEDILTQAGKLISNALPKLMDFTMSLTAGVSNLFIGFIVSIYLLAGKERFARQVKRLLTACLPELYRDRALRLGNIANTTFSGFISGQLLDAMIVGILCFLGMNLMPLSDAINPYLVLISTIIAITNIVPIFGPYIGGVPCTFIILMVDFKSAIWFVVLIVLIQTVDGNIILPKIVGDSIGLSGFWVMFAIILGGGLFGLPGMVLGIPAFAVIYKVVAIVINKRLAQKQAHQEQHHDGDHTITAGE